MSKPRPGTSVIPTLTMMFKLRMTALGRISGELGEEGRTPFEAKLSFPETKKNMNGCYEEG